jgi:hypothetical protein
MPPSRPHLASSPAHLPRSGVPAVTLTPLAAPLQPIFIYGQDAELDLLLEVNQVDMEDGGELTALLARVEAEGDMPDVAAYLRQRLGR